jgi:hypothetical protein
MNLLTSFLHAHALKEKPKKKGEFPEKFTFFNPSLPAGMDLLL